MKATKHFSRTILFLVTTFLALIAALTIKIVVDRPKMSSTKGGEPHEKALDFTRQPTTVVAPPQSTLSPATDHAVTSLTTKNTLRTSTNSRQIDGEVSVQTIKAQIKVGDKNHNLTAGTVPVFERIYIQPEQQVEIKLAYPEGEPGDPIVIQVEDGGSLDDGKIARVTKLDANKSLAFAFKASRFEGIHRVRLWKGADQKMLDFWAGDPLPVAGQQ